MDAILSQIPASIVGANFFDHSTMVTMLPPCGCYLNNLMFDLLWLHSSHNVVTKFRPLFMVTICGYYLIVFFCSYIMKEICLQLHLGEGKFCILYPY